MLDNCQYYDEATIQRLAQGLVSALDYLHTDLGIVHRDIKP